MPDQGDIVLVPVPFNNPHSGRRRPVIVISCHRFHQSSDDMVVVALTSLLSASPFSFVIGNADLSRGQLKRPSCVRVNKIYTLPRSLAIKTVGRVTSDVLEQIREQLADLAK